MKTFKLILVLLLVSLTTLSGLEFISEHIDNQAKNLVLIPYQNLFYELSETAKDFDNYISIVIFTNDEELVYQEKFHVNLSLNEETLKETVPSSYSREYYPVQFETDLSAGEYTLYISIADHHESKKREYRKAFIFPAKSKEIGYLFIAARIDEFRFIVRDEEYLKHQYDELQLMQAKIFEPDSTRIVVESERGTEFIKAEDFRNISSTLQNEDNFDLKIENFHSGKKYVSEPIYPGPAYFFQKKYTPKEQLAQLRYIINQNEYQYLKSLTKDNLQEGINEFWSSKDTDPLSIDNLFQETFYQRISYVDNNYRIRQSIPGWRTDRGRIYIMYGEPDQIVTDVFPIGKDPSITWYYYSLNKVFVFYDLRGFGDYELRDKWMH